jgi:hypothetical protein
LALLLREKERRTTATCPPGLEPNPSRAGGKQKEEREVPLVKKKEGNN